jgi:hypothetical protein
MLHGLSDPPRIEYRCRGVARTIGLLWILALLLLLALLNRLAPGRRVERRPPAPGGAPRATIASNTALTSADPQPEKPEPPTQIPPLARIAGVRVGWDTMGTLEKRLGRGMVVTGGHPRGARVWSVRGAGWTIFADGFDFRRNAADDSCVIDTIAVEAGEWRTGRPARISRRALTLWPGISLGMSRRGVLTCLIRNGITPKLQANTLTYAAPGFVHLDVNNDHYDRWEATLEFKRDRLARMMLGAR